MSLAETPSGERVHIGFVGRRNAGKSSLVNAVTGQELAVVSDVAGTTTDPVRKAMELLPVGPVVIVDTPGLDDAGGLGEKRVRKAREALRRCDVAVLVVDATRGPGDVERDLAADLARRGVPFVVARTKADLAGAPAGPVPAGAAPDDLPGAAAVISVCAPEGLGVFELKEAIAAAASGARPQRRPIADLIEPGDVVVLVVPIDESAPKGRLILPQQLVLRDILDAHASALTCQPEELTATLATLVSPPRLVVCDSQAFERVARDVPEDVPLTSFSILMARYKGSLSALVRGAGALSTLTDQSRVLISEGCTHHRQCADIGTGKLPAWRRAHAGASPTFAFTSGGEFPDDLTGIDLVVHCGGCMLNEREMASRMARAAASGVPMVNYGVAIAQMRGILERSLEPLGGIAQILGD